MASLWRNCRRQFPRPLPLRLHNHAGDDYYDDDDDDGCVAGPSGLEYEREVGVLGGDDQSDRR